MKFNDNKYRALNINGLNVVVNAYNNIVINTAYETYAVAEEVANKLNNIIDLDKDEYKIQ